MTENDIKRNLSEAYYRLWETIGHFEGSFIAGGSIVSLVLGEKVNDYDIFFESEQEFLYANALLNTAIQDRKQVTMVGESSYATTFMIGNDKYQFVRTRFDVPEVVVTHFDFRHTHAYFYFDMYKHSHLIFTSGNSPTMIRAKTLEFSGWADYPSQLLSRLQKFAVRGYITPRQTYSDIVCYIAGLSDQAIDNDAAANAYAPLEAYQRVLPTPPIGYEEESDDADDFEYGDCE